MYEIFERLLRERNITAYKVSRETGISQSTLSDWKNGKFVPKSDKLQKIAEYFGVTVDYLMGVGGKVIIDGIEPGYIDFIRDAKEKGYSPDDLRLMMDMLDIARRSGR